jgi:hypothetical protein
VVPIFLWGGPVGIELPYSLREQGPTQVLAPTRTKQKMHPTEEVHFSLVGPVGIEPTTHGLKVRCSNRLS